MWGGGLVHMGYGSNWKIWISLEIPFWGDSESSVPKLVTFLIRQGNDKPLRFKIWPPPNWTVQMFLDLFFERVMNLPRKCLIVPVHVLYKIVIGTGGAGGWPSRLISFKVVLDPNLEGILIWKGNFKFSLCVPIWQNQWFRQEEQVGWPSQFISLKVVPDPNLRGFWIWRGKFWNSNCVSPYEKIDNGC